MPIKVEPFVNPFKSLVKENGDKIKIVTHNGKTYEQVVQKK